MGLPTWAEGLGLQPHPEGGWYAETYRSSVEFTPPTHPGSRASATGIVFLLNPGEESRWHRVASDELWIHQRGDPLELVLGGTTAEPHADRTFRLGADYPNGDLPQALVPAGVWQAARPLGDPVLVACIVTPGFDFADFELH